MNVAVIANPQIDRLLTPADNTIELALQVKHQAINKMQIVMSQRRILDTQQIGLQFIACRFQRILQLAQSAGGF